MTRVGVIVHRKKRLQRADPAELRTALLDAGVLDPLWYEVPKSKKAPKAVRKAVAAGAELVLVWGGDGTVRRCIDELAGGEIPIGILPAGTANLLANGLGIPIDLAGAVDVALHGGRRRLDLGMINGERFAVMAGTGFDAVMIEGADDMKDRVGRLAYVWSAIKAVRIESGADPHRGRRRRLVRRFCDVRADRQHGHDLRRARRVRPSGPDDGRLEVGVVTADGVLDWIRVLVRIVRRQVDRTPLVRTTGGTTIDVRLGRRRDLRARWRRPQTGRAPRDHGRALVHRALRPGTRATVSPARFVPSPLTATDVGPWETLVRHGRWRLLVDAVVRLRAGDGTSHARSLAFLIALDRRAGAHQHHRRRHRRSGTRAIRDVVQAIISSLAPGPVGDALTGAVDQARQAGTGGRGVAIAQRHRRSGGDRHDRHGATAAELQPAVRHRT